MARRLPPLNSLRAFEAAARHLSFTRAAQELNVTQAAISHQVKGLEQHLGLRLFRRLNRALVLTDEGQRYFPAVRDGLDLLATATHRLRERENAGRVTISVTPSFAAKWLVPRLARFRAGQPDIDVRVHAADDVVDFIRDDVDLAVRYGAGGWSGLKADLLLRESFFPVCSPRLLEAARPLREPSDLQWHTLLHEERTLTDWQTWLTMMGVTGADASRGPVFSHGSNMIEAAVAGQGVGLGRSPLVDDDLAEGRLVRPFDASIAGDWAYYVVCPHATADNPRNVVLRDWLLAEASGAANPG
jgi:LysR family glycine cleavage system transcriptional activator